MVSSASESVQSGFRLEPFAKALFEPEQGHVQRWDVNKTVNWLNQAHFCRSEFGLCVTRAGASFSLKTSLTEVCADDAYAVELDLKRLNAAGFEVAGLWGRAGLGLVYVPCRASPTAGGRACLVVAEPARLLAQRSSWRWPARALKLELTQEACRAQAVLVDVAGRTVRLRLEASADVAGFASEAPLTVEWGELARAPTSARLLRRIEPEASLVLEISSAPQARFAPRTFRNPRILLSPPARLSFEHPLTGQRLEVDVIELSSSGLGLSASADAALWPGLVLKGLRLSLGAEDFMLAAVVVHCRSSPEGRLLCGLYIEDMALEAYAKLSALVARSEDVRIQVGGQVNLDDLWRFLFDSSFIYASKYRLIAGQAPALKHFYARLYSGEPRVFKSIVYQDAGVIYGHVSMVRAYSGVWMVQHLAALPLGGRKTGLKMLNQILNYLDGLFRLPDAAMGYLMFFYRPENSFPEHFFGGAARAIADRQSCALDEFGYASVQAADEELPASWRLCALDEDAWRLAARHYQGEADLMWGALGLTQADDRALQAEYERWGFRRGFERQGLYQDGELKALIIIDKAEQGLNLSETLNCLKFMVLDEDLPLEIARSALAVAARAYAPEPVPVLIHPLNYATQLGVKKSYTLLSVAGARGGAVFCETLKQLAARW